MTPRIKYFILLFILSAVFCSAQTIKKIEITGNSVFSETEIKSWAGISEGSILFEGLTDSVKARLSKNLILNGHLHSKFEGTKIEVSPDSQSAALLLIVDEGTSTRIQNIFFSADDSVRIKDHSEQFEYLEGEVFRPHEIEAYINELLTNLENKGFPFASVRVQSVYLYDDSTNDEHLADLHLKLSEGKSSTIDMIEIDGNTSTKDYVIIRELRIDPGEIYSQEKIEDLPKRLNKLRFFEPVPVPRFYLDSDDKGVLLINLKEKNTNNIDGIIGYVPSSNENESGYVTGLVNVTLRNIFGTGRAASIRWQKLDRNSQELELKYLEPWLFSYPFNLNAGLFQRIQDTTYIQRRLEGSLEYLATEDISASAIIATEEVIPTVREIPVFTVYNSSALITGVNLKIDLRDDPLSPTAGFLFETGYSYSRKKINGPDEYISPTLERNINLQRITAGLSGYYEIFSRNIIAISVNGKELRGPFFEQSDLWRLGGTRTVRGYREDQFLASRIAWSNLEYRILLTRRSYVFIFLDAGYYFREPDAERGIAEAEDYIFGYGLGLTVDTAIGLLLVNFGLAEGDSFSEGKFHFGILNEF